MNFKIIIYFYLLLNVGIYCIRQRIIGGENAYIRDFPYMVSIRNARTYMHFCGGTIISTQHILTAAHCLTDKEPYDEIKIYSQSSSSVLTNGPFYTINCVHIHSDYKEDTSKLLKYHHDVAVATIREVIEFNNVQNKVKLPKRNIGNDAIGVLVGWGVLFYKSKIMSDQLQQAWMLILDSKLCKEAVPFIHVEQICGYQREGVGACKGDSGSPLVSNGRVVGIASYAFECGKGLPDVYTNVYEYVDFINSIVQSK